MANTDDRMPPPMPESFSWHVDPSRPTGRREGSPPRATPPAPAREPDSPIAKPVAPSGDHRADAGTGVQGTSALGARGEETWPIEAAAAVLRGRWKLAVLWCLGAGPRRFNALAVALPGVTPKVLTEQLRELVRDGVVHRRSERSGPKHVEYELSTAGQELLPALEALYAWGRGWTAPPSR